MERAVLRAVLITAALLIIVGCAPANNVLFSHNPTVQTMPGISSEMQTAGFWIDKLENPDGVIMTAEGIEEFNFVAASNHNIIKVSEYDDYKSSADIRSSILELYNAVADRELYFENGVYADRKSLSGLYEQFRLDELSPQNPVSFGIVTQNVSQRVLPTDRKLARKGIGFGYIDRLQMNALDAGSPVAVLWSAKDGEWLYVRSALTVGWVRAAYVALCSRYEAAAWENPPEFIVAEKYRVSVYSGPALRGYISWLALGGRAPLDKAAIKFDNLIAILWPYRDDDGWLKVDTGYVESKDVSVGYLPYTSRNAINLAFEMLHAPYGWGGMNGEEDCSGFIMRVFGAMGLKLPRNSSQQGNTGDIVYSDQNNDNELSAKTAINSYGAPGVTALQFPGHIMLYLGSLGGEPYVIHAIWSFETDNGDGLIAFLPARVTVSNLNLGKGTKLGVYHKRITNARVMRLPQN